MNNENLQIESEFRRFLLGEMKDEERSKFEERFISDEELFEDLRVAEDELIETYVRDKLNLADKSKFESSFLTTEKRRERVIFTREMLKTFAAETALKKQESVGESASHWSILVSFFKQPQFAFGTAFAILILAFVGWFLLKNNTKPIEIAHTTPTPTPFISATKTPQPIDTPKVIETPKIISNSNQPTKSGINANKPQPTIEPTPKQPELPKPSVSTLALFVGSVRSEGKSNELNLPKNSSGANLQLNLESLDYKIYRAEIVNQNGDIVYKSGKLSGKNSKLNAFVPAKNLKRGDYIVKVYGENSQNKEQPVADFQFRVNQK